MAYNKEAQAKYAKKCKIYTFKLHPENDADIIEYLSRSDEPFSTLVKRLIREEMARQKSQEPQKADS